MEWACLWRPCCWMRGGARTSGTHSCRVRPSGGRVAGAVWSWSHCCWLEGPIRSRPRPSRGPHRSRGPNGVNMRGLHRFSGNTDLTDSSSQSLTTLRVLSYSSQRHRPRTSARAEGCCQATHVVESSHMDHWFSVIASGSELAANTVKELDDVGFVVIPGPVAPPQLSRLAAVYDAAVSGADPADVGGGRTTTRVWDFVNRAPDFDGLYVYQPILDACCRVIGAPFHLSTMHAREVHPGAPA